MQIEIHELICWAITLITTVSFLYERTKNKHIATYMTLQGILKGLQEKAKQYANLSGDINRNTQETISKETYNSFVKSMFADNNAICQNIMGIMKSLQHGKDIPFDIGNLNPNEKTIE